MPYSALKYLAFALVFSILKMSVAEATYLFENNFDNLAVEYLSLLAKRPTDNLAELSPAKQTACLHRYDDILDDGVIDIRIALGYFDWTTGMEVRSNGARYGYSPSMDLGAFAALKKRLLAPCQGQARFCGFEFGNRAGTIFQRHVAIHGNSYLAKIEIHFSSVTEFLQLNLGSQKVEQQMQTRFMENFFSRSLQDADAAFYFGHSRNGGGPDFAPPVFRKNTNKVDYGGYYELHKPGLKIVQSAFDSPSKTSILGLMSCASREHFLKDIRQWAPETGVITSTDVLNIDQVYTALIGGVDALLRGQCQKSFYESLRLTSKNKEYITMDGMFN